MKASASRGESTGPISARGVTALVQQGCRSHGAARQAGTWARRPWVAEGPGDSAPRPAGAVRSGAGWSGRLGEAGAGCLWEGASGAQPLLELGRVALQARAPVCSQASGPGSPGCRFPPGPAWAGRGSVESGVWLRGAGSVPQSLGSSRGSPGGRSMGPITPRPGSLLLITTDQYSPARVVWSGLRASRPGCGRLIKGGVESRVQLIRPGCQP